MSTKSLVRERKHRGNGRLYGDGRITGWRGYSGFESKQKRDGFFANMEYQIWLNTS